MSALFRSANIFCAWACELGASSAFCCRDAATGAVLAAPLPSPAICDRSRTSAAAALAPFQNDFFGSL
jgi:hypothetical protein